MASRSQPTRFGFPRINSHLMPFLPYVEKVSDSHAPEKLADTSPHKISVPALKNWISVCDAHHGGHCRRRINDDERRPLWLVDVLRQCIVPAAREHDYIALSYVWGDAASVALTMETIDSLPMEGSLRDVMLPQTIRDAIELVIRLDLRYLWIDRLCIVQDDGPSKHSQLKAMAAIYAGSYLTLVAAQGKDATASLWAGTLESKPFMSLIPAISTRHVRAPDPAVEPEKENAGSNDRGTKGPSAQSDNIKTLQGYVQKSVISVKAWPLQISKLFNKASTSSSNPTSFRLRDDPWRTPNTHFEIMDRQCVSLLSTPWFTRGWTFQEYIFSTRKVIFHNNTVNWECHCAAWHENQSSLSATPCSRQPNLTTHGFDIAPWPNFHRYARLVSLFTLRYFTFPEDVLDAFSGAMSVFALIYPGGFVTGMPQMVFDAALIWQPYHILDRREPAVVAAADAVLPSWSWVGWLGNVQSESWRSGYDYLRLEVEPRDPELPSDHQSTWRTIPTVQWHHSATLTSTRYPISTQATQYRDQYSLPYAELPEGWSRTVCETSRKTYFRHESIRDQDFHYPIPLQNSTSGAAHASRSRFLHCKTRHANLKVAEGVWRSKSTACAVVRLEDFDGQYIGCLRVNEVPQLRRGKPEEPCQVIELSAGSVDLDGDMPLAKQADADIFDEWFLEGWLQSEGLYEFYNVMWVEHVGDIAYRKAVGRVQKSIWEAVATEKIDVTLG